MVMKEEKKLYIAEKQKYIPEYGYCSPIKTVKKCILPAFADEQIHRIGLFRNEYIDDGDFKGYTTLKKCVNCGHTFGSGNLAVGGKIFRIKEAYYDNVKYNLGPIGEVELLKGKLFYGDEYIGLIKIDQTLDVDYYIENMNHKIIKDILSKLEVRPYDEPSHAVCRYIEKVAMVVYRTFEYKKNTSLDYDRFEECQTCLCSSCENRIDCSKCDTCDYGDSESEHKECL